MKYFCLSPIYFRDKTKNSPKLNKTLSGNKSTSLQNVIETKQKEEILHGTFPNFSESINQYTPEGIKAIEKT